MASQRKYIFLSLFLGGLFLIAYAFLRVPSGPVVIAPFFLAELGDRQMTFIITNSLPNDLRWIAIVEVGGPHNWRAAATQPKPPKPDKVGFRTLSAHSAYWLPVSVPEERGTWRLRCVMMRPQTAFEKRFTTIYSKLRMAPWSWSVESPSVKTDDANHTR
jgi:hypothetical protein